jgi:hypothetical protein
MVAMMVVVNRQSRMGNPLGDGARLAGHADHGNGGWGDVRAVMDGLAGEAIMHVRLLLAIGAIAMAQGIQPALADGPAPPPQLVIRDSDALRITNARLRFDGDVLRLSGRICRRANRLGMEPYALDIDRIAADGSRAEHADAFLPRLSLRFDQACGMWQTTFKGPIAPGDTIMVCVPRPHGHCRTD